MSALSRNKQSNAGLRWFITAVAFLLLFAAFTVVVMKGVLLYPTLVIEQWLLHRPLTGSIASFLNGNCWEKRWRA